MGRRKKPETLPEIREEISRAEDEQRKLENKIKLMENSLKAQARKERTNRLCTEAGILESHIPELKTMDEAVKSRFLDVMAHSKEAIQFLQEGGYRDVKTPTETEVGK